MSSFAYLINRKERIIVEAYRYYSDGTRKIRQTEENALTAFIEHCMHNHLIIEVVYDEFHPHDDFPNDESWIPYKEFKI